VKLCHINRSGKVFFRQTVFREIWVSEFDVDFRLLLESEATEDRLVPIKRAVFTDAHVHQLWFVIAVSCGSVL